VTTSHWPLVYDALIAKFQTLSGLAVYDGPEFTLTEDRVGEFVIVGGNGDPEGEPGGLDQQWVGLGAKSRDETGTVVCAVIVQSGDTTLKPSRDRAFAILDTLTASLLTDPTLGGAVTDGWLLPLSGAPEQRENSLGSYVRLSLTVSFKSRV
jgi:hypothetical protein